MNRVVMRGKVDPDGVVRVAIPVGASEADREVQVTIEPVPAPNMSHDQWQKFIGATAGSITDPTFIRQPQGDYERREAWP